MAYDPAMDEFAQTRAPDDLFFDDDFTPIPEPVVEASPAPAPAPAPAPSTAPPTAPQGPANSARGRDGHRGGRGRGGRRGGAQAPVPTGPAAAVAPEGAANENSEADGAAAETAKPPQTPHKEGAVRGDRSGTGGVKRTKLTEAELSEKMASISLKNSLLTAAHARAEADLASFEAREAQAAQQSAEKRKQMQARQKVDRQNRAQMMGEREKNRQRKLEAVGGREWDFEKEEGFGGTGDEKRVGSMRGAFGGVVGGVGGNAPRGEVAEEDNAPPSTPPHRGGERGRGRGRGRGGRRGGRGDHSNTPRSAAPAQSQKPPSASDFPDLPAATAAKETTSTISQPKVLDFPIKGKATNKNPTTSTTSQPAAVKAGEEPRPAPPRKQDSFGLPSPAAGKSWADQVEGAS